MGKIGGMEKLMIGFLGLIAGSFALTGVSHCNRESYRIKVIDKERVVSGSGDTSSSKYLIFAELPDGSKKVFENTDSPLELKWNSSDVYGGLEVGETYDIKTYGWRVRPLSQYENILGAERVEGGADSD